MNIGIKLPRNTILLLPVWLLRRLRTGSFDAGRGGPKPRLDQAALNKVRRWAKEKSQPTLQGLCERLCQQRGIELSLVRMGKVLEGMGLFRARVRPRLSGPILKVVRALEKQNPRATLDEFCQRVREHCGVTVSLATMSLILQRLGLAKGQGRPLFNESALERLKRLAQRNPEATVTACTFVICMPRFFTCPDSIMRVDPSLCTSQLPLDGGCGHCRATDHCLSRL
jgi:transposase